MASASAEDLEEISEGHASARDKAEARESDIRDKTQARRALNRMHGVKVRTTRKKTKRHYG